jgi:DUF2934 family protein
MPKASNFSSGYSSSSASKSSAPRNSPIPRNEPTSRQISHEQIAKRAYEIYVSGKGGSALENWTRAERELKGQ